MSFILVVEPDAKSATAIHDVLASEGLEVQSVSDPDAALQMAAARAPKLVIVNGDVKQADRLLSSFSRRQGGPGAVALISPSGHGQDSLKADELLQKPFTDSALKQAVERCWEAERGAGASGRSTGGLQFSSAEIFGDVLAELEEDAAVTPPQGVKSAADTAATHRPVSVDEPQQRQPAAAPPSVDAEVDLLLADTLAGLDLEPTGPAPSASPVATEPASLPPASRPKAPDVAPERPVPAPEPPAPVAEPPAPVAAASAIAEPEEVVREEPSIDVLEPVDGQDMDDGDSRSRMVLIAAIAVTALIGVLLVVLLNFRGDGAEETSAASVAAVTESTASPVDEPDVAATTLQAEGDAATEIETEAATEQSPPPPISPPSTAPQPTAQKTAPAEVTPPPAAAFEVAASEAEVAEPEVAEVEPVVTEPAVVELPEPAASGVEAADSQAATAPAAPTIVTEEAAEVSLEPAAEEELSIDEAALTAAAVESAADDSASAEPQETVVSRQADAVTPISSSPTSVVDGPLTAADPELTAAVPETPSVQVQPGDLVTMGPGVVAPKLVNFTKPRYPEMARRLHKQGTVVAAVLIDEAGEVIEAKLVQTVMATFDSAVLRAVKRAKFSPATKDGIPVKMWRNIEVRLQADS